MNKLIFLKVLIFIILFPLILNCGKKSEITWDTKVYSEPSLNSKIVGELKKGDVVEPSEYLNHARLQKDFIRIKTDKLEGFVSPKSVVIGQDPANSVFKWGYRKDYENFYNPIDKKHYPQGNEWPDLKSLSKEKISLEVLVKDEKLEQ